MTLKIDQQLRRNDCGISAAKTLCNILEADIPRQTIEQNIPLNQDGASLEGINKFFKNHGFQTKFHLLDLNDLQNQEAEFNACFPCITPIRKKKGLHYIILNGFKRGRLRVYDPSRVKEYYLSIEAFKKRAYYSSSSLEYADLHEVMALKVRAEMKQRPVTLPKNPGPKDWIELFNKLAYFGYLKEQFGFKNEEAENAFLEDLIHHQEMGILPKNFKNILLDENKRVNIQAPVVLSVQKPDNLPIVATSSSVGNIYWRLFKSIRSIQSLWGIFLLTTIVAGLITYIAVFINQILIDHVLPSYQLNVLVLFTIGVGIFYLFDIAFTVYKRYVSIHLSNTLDRYFLSVFDEKLNRYSIRFLQSFRRGDLTERLSDSMKLKSFFVTFFSKIFVNVIIAIFSLGILLAIDWKLSFLVLIVLGVFTGMFVGFTPLIRRLEQDRFAKKADFFSRFIEKIDGIQVIKALQLEGYSSGEIRASINALIEVQTKAKYVGLLNTAMSSVIVSVAILAIILMTSREMILYQTISLGMIITFVALSKKIFKAFRSLLDYNLTLQEHQVILKRFFDFSEETQKIQQNGINKLHQIRFESFQLQNLNFAYVDEQYILKNLSLKLSRGEKIWIQGINGSGKSTLCRIIGLLYPPSKGDILINGIDQSLYEESVLRNKIVLVTNEDLLFNDTLLFNISFGRKIDMERLIYYCKLLKFYDFIQAHPDKLSMMVHENGRNLSTGQRKKVLLLRALVTDAELIVLDEIFNGIDAESKLKAEQLINMLAGKSFIVISHMPVEEIEFDKKYELNNGTLILTAS